MTHQESVAEFRKRVLREAKAHELGNVDVVEPKISEAWAAAMQTLGEGADNWATAIPTIQESLQPFFNSVNQMAAKVHTTLQEANKKQEVAGFHINEAGVGVLVLGGNDSDESERPANPNAKPEMSLAQQVSQVQQDQLIRNMTPMDWDRPGSIGYNHIGLVADDGSPAIISGRITAGELRANSISSNVVRGPTPGVLNIDEVSLMPVSENSFLFREQGRLLRRNAMREEPDA